MLKVELAANRAASSWDDIKHIVKVYGGMQVGGNAHTGEIGTGSGFDLDDDAADVTLPVKRAVRIRETATSPDTILIRGRIADKGVARGEVPIGNARAFDVGIDDHNSDLRGIPIRKWDRPRETDYQRVIALWRKFLKGSPRASTRLAIKYRSGPMDGLGSVRNANRVTLAKKSYTDTDPYAVLHDIAESAGKEFFVTVDGELFYDLPTSTRYHASLSITDDDPNMSTEFPPVYGVAGDQDGSEFLSGATLTWGAQVSTHDDEVQELTIEHADGGTYTLSFDGDTTSSLAHDASASAVQAALRGLSSIAGANVVVSGDNPYTIQFIGALGGEDVPAISVDDGALTNSAAPPDPSATIATTQQGGEGTVTVPRRISAVREAVEENHDFWREVIALDDVGSQEDARERLRTLLSNQAREDRTYIVAIDLLDEQMWRIKYGQTVSFRAAGAGVLSPTVLRVGRLLWEPLAPSHYRAHMELGFPKKLVPRIRRGQKKRPLVTAGTTTGGAWIDLDTFSRTLESEDDFGRADNDRDEDRYWGGGGGDT